MSHGGEEVAGGDGDGRAASQTAAVLEAWVTGRTSLCSPRSSLTEDDEDNDVQPSTVLSEHMSCPDMVQLEGDGGGPLYELSPLLAQLPFRTGLSKHYHGRSQSFTSLSDAKCVQDLAKKTTPYIARKKACRGCAAAGQGMNHLPISHHFMIACRQEQGAQASCTAA